MNIAALHEEHSIEANGLPLDPPRGDDTERLRTVLAPFASIAVDRGLPFQVPTSKIDVYPDHLFIVLHFPRYIREKGTPSPSSSLYMLGKDFLITVHNGELKPLSRSSPSCRETAPWRRSWSGRLPLLYRIVRMLIENLRSWRPRSRETSRTSRRSL